MSAFVVALVSILAQSAPAEMLRGPVVAVTDGDTIDIDAGRSGVTIRLQGIDAPETPQRFGDQSTAALTKRLKGKMVRVDVTGEDKYGRTLGDVYLGKEWVNGWLVREGFAWHFTKYSDSEKLARYEQIAREKKRGLWDDPFEPEAPWSYRARQEEYRAKKRADRGLAADDSSGDPASDAAGTGTVHVTRTGTKYHSAGCRHLKSDQPMSLEQAQKLGYTPCSVCGGRPDG